MNKEFYFNIPGEFERKLLNLMKQRYGKDIRVEFSKVKVKIKK